MTTTTSATRRQEPRLREGGPLGEEYEHEPVPQGARRGLLSVSAVWFGFPMNLGNAVFGGVIVYNLGLAQGAAAILLGNLVLFAYVGALSWLAGRTGENFSHQAARTFGTLGSRIPAAFLSTVVIGWYSFQIGLSGTTLQEALGWAPLLGALAGGVLYTVLTVLGIRALSLIGLVATPLFVVLAGVALWFGLAEGGTSLGHALSYEGAGHALSFGAAMSIVIAGFSDSGTMTADFTRWARSGRAAVAAASCAFPFANSVSYLVGGLVVAVGGAVDPAVNGGGFLGLLTGHGPLLTSVAVLFVFVNLGSVASHCLYNGAVGWSAITPFRMRPLAIALSVLGLVAAMTGVWSLFLDWLNLLGIFVPPIGAVLITDQLFLRRRTAGREARAYRPGALVAWGAGAGAATVAHYLLPGSVDALIGMAVACGVFLAVERTAPAPVAQVA
ncbi:MULTISPECIES: cytosine permease [unclassified Streptomyces]|uniref:purine-cytosine permease family protein n=1 Tax=unclassified Streptomyces TaxID=2593676 RepID=UPI002E304D2C|nr:cytosine permease [Streptomyces sp. NBC_01460]WSS30837.1 cytosine permease [Streptomyces sp. NBC_01185]